jgi:hypothetical protein
MTRNKFDHYQTPEALHSALRSHFLNLGLNAGRNVVTLRFWRSRYRFYWYTGGRSHRGGRLAVSSRFRFARGTPGGRGACRRSPLGRARALTARNASTRSAAVSATSSPACSTKARQLRWQERHGKLSVRAVRAREAEARRRAASAAVRDTQDEQYRERQDTRARFEQKMPPGLHETADQETRPAAITDTTSTLAYPLWRPLEGLL